MNNREKEVLSIREISDMLRMCSRSFLAMRQRLESDPIKAFPSPIPGTKLWTWVAVEAWLRQVCVRGDIHKKVGRPRSADSATRRGVDE